MFSLCDTQLRFAGGMEPSPLGFDYNAVLIVMNSADIENKKDFWQRFRILEAVTVDCINADIEAQRKKDGRR